MQDYKTLDKQHADIVEYQYVLMKATYNIWTCAFIGLWVPLWQYYVQSDQPGWAYMVSCGSLCAVQLLIYSLARFGERGKYMYPNDVACFKSRTLMSWFWLLSTYILPAAIVITSIAGAIVGRENRLMMTPFFFIICVQLGNFVMFGASDYARQRNTGE